MLPLILPLKSPKKLPKKLPKKSDTSSLRGSLREIVESGRNTGLSIKLAKYRHLIPEYVKNYVPLNAFIA
jgi:hypothetical protein